MRLVLALTLCVVFAAAGSAKIRALSVSDLVAAARLIVIAEVVAVTEDAGKPDGLPIRNELKVLRTLKGTCDASQPLTLHTRYKPGQRLREDSIVFPDAGRRVLLFLKSNFAGRLIPVNGIQGLWPLETGTDKPEGMGFRYSIGDIENLIAKQPK